MNSAWRSPLRPRRIGHGRVRGLRRRTGGACSDRIGFLRMTLESGLLRTFGRCALPDGLSRRESDKKVAPSFAIEAPVTFSSPFLPESRFQNVRVVSSILTGNWGQKRVLVVRSDSRRLPCIHSAIVGSSVLFLSSSFFRFTPRLRRQTPAMPSPRSRRKSNWSSRRCGDQWQRRRRHRLGQARLSRSWKTASPKPSLLSKSTTAHRPLKSRCPRCLPTCTPISRSRRPPTL